MLGQEIENMASILIWPIIKRNCYHLGLNAVIDPIAAIRDAAQLIPGNT